MDFQKYLRIALLVILAILFSVLWIRWQQKYDITPPQTVQTQQAATSGQTPNLSVTTPGSNATTAGNTTVTAGITQSSDSIVTVTTDVLKTTIDLQGGNIISTQLLDYPDTLHSQTPFTLLSDNADQYYVAQSGLIGAGLPSTLLPFKTGEMTYTLNNRNQNQIVVSLTWQGNGLQLVKTYTFTKGKYDIAVNYHVTNLSAQPWQGRFYGQLLRTPVIEEHSLLASYTTFTGAAMSTPADHYQKFKFTDLAEEDINQSAQGGWIAMVQHYFISAWVPDQQQTTQYYSQVYQNNTYGVGVSNPVITVPAKGQADTGATLYIGPAISDLLKPVAPYLNLTIDYGWLWFISIAIFWIMSTIHHFLPNWGVAIILVTILIKIIFYPLSEKSYRSMARMRQLQPKLKALKERFGDDKQKMGRATMELYREEKVNPLSGCLPMLVQIPVFIGLYWMLMESVELRQAPFMLWIHDLSQRDPYFVLPILMGLSMFIQQRLNPPPPDPMQAKVMMFLPVIFTAMFLSFPAGLVLYWLVNNVVSILQQWYVMRKVNNQMPVKN
jgi:YidC/Oxa1 family membrane protein insertase